MIVEFTSQSARDALNPAAHTGRLVNCYREPMVAGGRGVYQIRAVPGMAQIADLERAAMPAAMVFQDRFLVVSGGDLISIGATGDVQVIGAVGNSAETSISENTGYATIVAGGKYWTWDGTTLDEVDVGFDAGSVAYLGGYTVVTELGGRRFAWSDLADPTTFDGANIASAEINNDDIIRAVVLKDGLHLFKASGFEIWGVSGDAGPGAFVRISGAMEETGLRSYGLVTTLPNGMAFCGTDGRMHIYAGVMQPVSTPPMEVALDRYDAERMFYYEKRGHGFVCVAFRDVPAWCYDLATGEWHERAEDGDAWRAVLSAKVGSEWWIGADNGKVSRLTDACRDFGAPLVREMTSLPVVFPTPTVVSELEVFPVVGYGMQDEGASGYTDAAVLSLPPGAVEGAYDARPAQISLRVSRDGVSFGNMKSKDLGERGNHGKRVIFRNLGLFQRVGAFRLVLSSLRDVPIVSTVDVK